MSNLGRDLEQLLRGGAQASTNVYAGLIRRCGEERALAQGKRLHQHITAAGCAGHTFLGNLLVQMYGKCGEPGLARQAFDGLASKNEFSCSILINNYVQSSRPAEAIAVFRKMPIWGILPDQFIFSSVVKACSSLGDLQLGKEIHARMMADCRFKAWDSIVQLNLVDMYVKCGSLEDARAVFDGMQDRDVFAWTTMLSGYAQQGNPAEAVRLFWKMELEGLEADAFTLSSLFAACSNAVDRKLGECMHRRVSLVGLHHDTVLQNSIMNMYSKCGSVEEARLVFDNILVKNVCSWTSMVAAYAQNGYSSQAWQLFYSMELEGVEPDPVTYVSLLGACLTVEHGRAIHDRVLALGHSDDEDVITGLVKMYAGFGSLELADKLRQGNKNSVICCTVLIAAFAEQGSESRAMELFREMDADGIQANEVTLCTVLSSCCWSLPALKDIHDGIAGDPSTSALVGTALVDAYARRGYLQDARAVFDSWKCSRDSAFWNAMVAAYNQAGQVDESMLLYYDMFLQGVPPDSFTFSMVLANCSTLQRGKSIYRQAVGMGYSSNTVLQNSFLTMLSRCGSLVEAREAFEMMENRDSASWSSIIGGYAQTGHLQQVLELYRKMDVEPNRVTYTHVLEACSSLGEIEQARVVHSRFSSSGVKSKVVESTLVNMYSRAGLFADARGVFEAGTTRKDSISWNAMLGAHAQHGDQLQVVQVYHSMNIEGCEVSYITFISLLIACSAAGLLDQCCEYFGSMVVDHGIVPVAEHYVCMVDLLGRLGQLQEAEEVIRCMPIQPESSTWRTLLAACRIHNDVERACRVLDWIPGDGPALVLWSNIYNNLETPPRY